MSQPAPRIATSRSIVDAGGRRYAFADHNCFACGGQNPIGMHLEIELGDGSARTEWVPTADFVGWEEKVHGGILTTLLDEVMAWAPASHDAWAVTAEMQIRFHAPASPGERLVATGHVLEKRRRIYRVAGEIRGQDGRLVASATGRFLGASPSAKNELKDRYGMPSAQPDIATHTTDATR